MKERNGFPYSKETVKLVLDTHLPTKWLAVDTETGDVWRGNDEGKWARHGRAAHGLLSVAIRKLDSIKQARLTEAIAAYLKGD